MRIRPPKRGFIRWWGVRVFLPSKSANSLLHFFACFLHCTWYLFVATRHHRRALDRFCPSAPEPVQPSLPGITSLTVTPHPPTPPHPTAVQQVLDTEAPSWTLSKPGPARSERPPGGGAVEEHEAFVTAARNRVKPIRAGMAAAPPATKGAPPRVRPLLPVPSFG